MLSLPISDAHARCLGPTMEDSKMIRACYCLILLCAISNAPVYAGDNTDLIHSYELVPADPAPNMPFELHIVYENGLLIDDDQTSVTIDGSDIAVAVGFVFNICPPLQPCPPELVGKIAIPGLPSGTYHMRIVDSDGAPPFDASIDFVVGPVPPAPIPTISQYTMTILVLLILAAGVTSILSLCRGNRREMP